MQQNIPFGNQDIISQISSYMDNQTYRQFNATNQYHRLYLTSLIDFIFELLINNAIHINKNL